MNILKFDIPENWREVPKKDFDYIMQVVQWTRESYKNGVGYRVSGDMVGFETNAGKFHLHPMFTQYEPDSISEVREILNGQDDGSKVARIWFEFKYGLKRGTQSNPEFGYADIKALLQAAIKRVRREVKDPEVRNQVNGRFIVLIKRCDEFILNPDSTKATCPKCHLNVFICPCEKQDPILGRGDKEDS